MIFPALSCRECNESFEARMPAGPAGVVTLVTTGAAGATGFGLGLGAGVGAGGGVLGAACGAADIPVSLSAMVDSAGASCRSRLRLSAAAVLSPPPLPHATSASSARLAAIDLVIVRFLQRIDLPIG